MICFAENLKRFRAERGLTQEDVANCLGITPQSVSKWERGETYPDITFLPAIANIFDTSIDILIGMDEIRAKRTLWEIHGRATDYMKAQKYDEAEKVYRDAMKVYPRDPGMLLGLASVLALKGDTKESIGLIETGLPLSGNEKQKATMRAALCFLYAKAGEREKAKELAYHLPHTRESREVITPLIDTLSTDEEFDKNIKYIILGE
jgi:transcriptional regulator with XRE-family HTH domain